MPIRFLTSSMTSRKQLTRLAALLATLTTISLLPTAGASADSLATPASRPQIVAGIAAQPSPLLPLAGGSNFRDLGGYETIDHRRVRRGLLFRSGNMGNLTPADQTYLNQIGFKTIVDLRSTEEIELFPNHWASASHINYLHHDYSMMTMLKASSNKNSTTAQSSIGSDQLVAFYRQLPQQLDAQLHIYFDQLLQNKVPLVVNCSAGQDRTGLASALLLSALDVPRQTIIDDYLLSTEYRNPANELGDVNLESAAETNAVARMFLRSKYKASSKPEPLLTPDGTPLLAIAFAQIEADYGSIDRYLASELGIDSSAKKKLQALYLQ